MLRDRIVSLLEPSWLQPASRGIVALLISLAALPYPPAPKLPRHALTRTADFLKTRGRQIVNGAGQPVYLRGTNAGGWLVHEEWMCPTQAPDQRTLRDTLERRFGPQKRDELLNAYRDAYWTEDDFDICAAMGMTCLRLPFLYWDIADEEGNIVSFDRLDWFVEHCARRGMYVILDLHGAYGSQNGKHHSGNMGDGDGLYGSAQNRARTLKLWRGIAAHYKGNPAVAGYDLLNEPENTTGHTGKAQWEYYDLLYKAVRAEEPGHILLIEACWEPKDLPHPRAYGWENVVYEYHHYSWDDQTERGVILHETANSLDEVYHFYGVPILIGEFACFGKDAAWRGTLGLYNKLGFHWTTWTYKVRSENHSGDPHWGIYVQDLPRADLENGTEEDILAIWSQVGTVHASETRLKGILEEFL